MYLKNCYSLLKLLYFFELTFQITQFLVKILKDRAKIAENNCCEEFNNFQF